MQGVQNCRRIQDAAGKSGPASPVGLPASCPLFLERSIPSPCLINHEKAAILAAPGFEEIELMAPLDILRRLNFDVQLAGVQSDKVVSTQ